MLEVDAPLPPTLSQPLPHYLFCPLCLFIDVIVYEFSISIEQEPFSFFLFIFISLDSICVFCGTILHLRILSIHYTHVNTKMFCVLLSRLK